jgi:hypothetical protein
MDIWNHGVYDVDPVVEGSREAWQLALLVAGKADSIVVLDVSVMGEGTLASQARTSSISGFERIKTEPHHGESSL